MEWLDHQGSRPPHARLRIGGIAVPRRCCQIRGASPRRSLPPLGCYFPPWTKRARTRSTSAASRPSMVRAEYVVCAAVSHDRRWAESGKKPRVLGGRSNVGGMGASACCLQRPSDSMCRPRRASPNEVRLAVLPLAAGGARPHRGGQPASATCSLPAPNQSTSARKVPCLCRCRAGGRPRPTAGAVSWASFCCERSFLLHLGMPPRQTGGPGPPPQPRTAHVPRPRPRLWPRPPIQQG
mmetsp:Transcript_5556/g.12625  ORF Transcript_5556/g.12625 Transcript_5556/m.12625 type:complete len:238 (-) Transcript_5556:463-1176(-)